MTDATKVGEPTLVDPKQVSAPDMVRAANSSIIGSMLGANKVGVERVENGAVPAANAPVPRSDAAGARRPDQLPPRAMRLALPRRLRRPSLQRVALGWRTVLHAAADNSAVPEMKNDLQPAAATPPPGATAPPAPHSERCRGASTSSDSSTQPAPAASSGSAQQRARHDDNKESSSKKKKKNHWPF